MEQYLIDDYNVYEDTKYLTEETQIEEYFKDNGYDYFDCGQGYYEEEVDLLLKIQNTYYQVYLQAEIGRSAKQDVGDRIYFVDEISSVTYKEINKPLPKLKTIKTYTLELSKEKENILNAFLLNNNIKICHQK